MGKTIDLEGIYRKLNLLLDQLEELFAEPLPRDQRISGAVLADDVDELLTECEGYLVDNVNPGEIEGESLITRAEVVFEDAEQLLRVIRYSLNQSRV